MKCAPLTKLVLPKNTTEVFYVYYLKTLLLDLASAIFWKQFLSILKVVRFWYGLVWLGMVCTVNLRRIHKKKNFENRVSMLSDVL